MRTTSGRPTHSCVVMGFLKVILLWTCIGNSATFGGFIPGTVGGRYDGGVLLPGYEIIASDYRTIDASTGFLEFDLATLSPTPNASIILDLADSGGFTAGPSSTRIFIYSGDGAITLSDLTIAAITSFDITRAFQSGGTQHDVTDIVNGILADGGTHAGFRFEAITGGVGGQDAFGFESYNQLIFSDYAADVPEPSSLALFGMGSLSLFVGGWRRRKTKTAARKTR